ncbi:SDR family NAD(P)-dependent oxidoreductase [Angustibacter aerolatus]
MELALDGKVAVVTGGTSGIGLAVVEGMAAEGVHVVVAARGGDRAREVAGRVAEEHGVQTLPVTCDVATAEGCQALTDAVVERFGGCDLLVNNAGAGSNETILDAPDERWQSFWDLHVMAAVRLARSLVPTMIARGGGVVLHNASICAVQPLGYEPVYNTTKAALMMFSKNLANEVIGSGVRVNCVNPGLVLTPDWVRTATDLTADEGGDWQGYLDRIARDNAPIGRFAQPQEVADLMVFLCSDRASYVVGSTTYVDGGWLKTV